MTELDDDVLDAVALVEAIRAQKAADAAVILPGMRAYQVAIVLAKIVAEAADDLNIPPDRLRYWAERAARRP